MESGHRAVVVDDDPDIRDLLVHCLRQAGHDVHCAESGEAAVELVREVGPDLVTLDLTLPDMDGTEVCRRIRDFTDAYVIMITGRSSEIDRLVGLEVGADDYMAKPFSPREVRARAAALLRRPRLGAAPAQAAGSTRDAAMAAVPAPRPTGVAVPPVGEQARPQVAESVDVGGGLVLVPARKAALLDGEPLPLTPVELDILATLTSRPGEVWERGDLVREVWQGDFIESDFLVDVHVANLRRKLRRAGGEREWIRTVGGAGYCFAPA